MNVGTPDQPTVASVKSYLKQFLLDPDVIDIPAPLRHLLVRGIILQTRPRNIAPRYKSIWLKEGSPLRVYSQKMSDSIEMRLGNTICELGMRYGNPSIESGIDKLRDAGVEELLLAPLFPQHAQATTESSLKCAYKHINKIGWKPIISELGHFETAPEYIQPLVSSIKPHLDNDSHLLFSYHGLPISHVKRSDVNKNHCQKVNNCCSISTESNKSCYAHHCMMTTFAAVDSLNLGIEDWSISYQSRLGPVKWLTPSTLSKVEELANKGVKKLVIVSPAFVADGLETLEELDIEIREHFIKCGGEEMRVVNCLNDDPAWISGLSKLIQSSFAAINEERLPLAL